MKQSMITLRTMLTVLLCAACMTMAYADNPITKKQMIGKWHIKGTDSQYIDKEEVDGNVELDGIIEFKDHGRIALDFDAIMHLMIEEGEYKIDMVVTINFKCGGIWTLAQNRLLNTLEEVETDVKDIKIFVNGSDATESLDSVFLNMIKEQGVLDELINETKNHVSTEQLTDYTGKTVMMGDMKLTRL